MGKAVWDYKAQFDSCGADVDFDCYIAETLLSEGRYIPHLESTLEKYKTDSLDELAAKQKSKFQEYPKLNTLFTDIEMPLVPVLCSMEKNGITVDKTRLKETEEEIKKKIAELTETILKQVGYEINLASPTQIGQFLAEKMMVPLSKTKTGKYATNENELQKYSVQFPIIQQILQYRELTKLLTTYTQTLLDKIDDKGRVHTTYSQVSVNTGRLSSANPNLQNIPVGSELGLKIKSCFVAAEGKTLLSFDYSQQELRILAHLSQEEKLIEAFTSKRDVHTTTASQLFGVPYDEVTKKQRMVAKTINFGVIYGMSSFGMSQGLNIPVEEAAKFIDNFYTTFPKIKLYYDQYLKTGLKNDYVETMLGRRRFVKLYPQQKFIDNASKRVLMNFPIQGTAAELMKLAMVKIYTDILTKQSGIQLLLQIHDELVFEVPDKEEFISKAVKDIQQIMENTYPLVVPMDVEVKKGKRWGEMEQLPYSY